MFFGKYIYGIEAALGPELKRIERFMKSGCPGDYKKECFDVQHKRVF